jgi:hypothetical protein
MTDQIVLLESRTMRASLGTRVEVLDKVKALLLLPDGVHVTAKTAAEYFEVEYEALHKVVQRHREELESNGLVVLRGSALAAFERDNMSLSNKSYPQVRSNLTVLPRRAVLNLAMLLRDSEVARQVRTSLLDAEEVARSALTAVVDSAALERCVTEIAKRVVDDRLEPHTRIIGAMSVRLVDVHSAVENISETLQALRDEVAELRVDRGLALLWRKRRRG